LTLNPSELVSYIGPVFELNVTKRHTMAYAACLNDLLPIYFDDVTHPKLGIHPLFPVCCEWPALLDFFHENNLPMHRMVHATHDLHIYQPLSLGQSYFTTAEVISLEQRTPGVYLTWKLKTVDAEDTLVNETWQGNLFLGAKTEDCGAFPQIAPSTPKFSSPLVGTQVSSLEISGGLAHTYTECARIWNPIHTERSVSHRGGMAEPLLHGTATLALAVSYIVKNILNSSPNKIRRIGCRFSRPVMTPARLKIETLERERKLILFQVLSPKGDIVLRDGFIETN
jgi:hypothetical protein